MDSIAGAVCVCCAVCDLVPSQTRWARRSEELHQFRGHFCRQPRLLFATPVRKPQGPDNGSGYKQAVVTSLL